ncbi:cytochrome b/b6 domain-containing protein [Bacterioplanes sanyensis]|nr:cytochrome b/b6 domain-containing protein [Bacterioplanes sanyensis]
MSSTHSTLTWDAFIRLFHWLLVACISFGWWSGEQGGEWMEWHMRSGYAVLALVMFRLLWGFTGTPFARFRQFVRSPLTVWRYANGLWRKDASTYQGHNPLGGWMVVALLLLCSAQAGTGLFANDEIFTEGPLVALVSYDLSVEITRWHRTLFDLLLAAIALHLIGVATHQWGKKEPLLQAMLHGRKPSQSNDNSVATPWLRGILVAAIAATSVWALISL